jgi:hypothetical protein
MEDQTRDIAQSLLTLPHDVVPLPTKGLFYRNKKKSVKVGYLTASDENILMAGGEDITVNLIRNKLYEPDMRVEDLMEADVEAILIFLRNTSFGPEISLSLTDPKTKKLFKTSVGLDSLPIIEGKIPNEDGTFTTVLPKSNVSVKLKLLTYGEGLEINKILNSYPEGRIPPRVTLRLSKQIIEINGNSDKGYISQFIETMPIGDSKHIKNFLEECETKLDMRKTVTAPSGELLTFNVGFGVDFFRPFF